MPQKNKATETLISRVSNFIDQCRLDFEQWKFASTPGGSETLYASAFACMLYHYIGRLDHFTPDDKKLWADYLNSWQNAETGLFIGPELVPDELKSRKHSYEHIAHHLAIHIIPALNLLGAQPNYPLTFAHAYLNLDYLQDWLENRNWQDAWLEGNNLLFVGQLLVYLRDFEGFKQAQPALDLYFAWLEQEIDPATGLWGSNGYCSNAAALYGGYHQLLVYYYEGRPVQYPDRLVDVALSLQHMDGGFNLDGGGGACEDTDAIDILVNVYKITGYKHPHIRIALRKAVAHILQRQMPDGGFVYSLDRPFVHMGIQKTSSPPNQSNLFPTWFRVHTLALMSEILTDEPLLQWDWQFNDSLSMGWHQPWERANHMLGWQTKLQERLLTVARFIREKMQKIYARVRSIGGKIKRRIVRREIRE